MRGGSPNRLLGALAGAVGGLAGSWAMVQFNHLIWPSGAGTDRPGRDSHAHHRRSALPNDSDSTFADEPGSRQIASAVAQPLVGRPLTEQEKDVGGPIAHYLFGLTMGALYGASAEVNASTTAWAGVPFGTGVWLAADEMGMSLAGFAEESPTEYPLSRHAAALGSHVIFGLTVEGVRRALRGTPATA
jgi:putative membrane protein